MIDIEIEGDPRGGVIGCDYPECGMQIGVFHRMKWGFPQ